MVILNPRELIAPKAWVTGCQTAEHTTNILVGLLALPAGLGVKTPDLSTELLPKPGGRLRTPIRNYINQQAMDYDLPTVEWTPGRREPYKGGRNLPH